MPQFIYTMKGLGKVHPPDARVLDDIWLSFYYGAKIGVLMGTAYIATSEAVACNAVVPAFQQAAVAGTGTAVWWEQQIDPTIVFGIPMIATIGKENRPTENLQLEPDIRVPLKYEDFLAGRDTQLEAAVKEMLAEIKE